MSTALFPDYSRNQTATKAAPTSHQSAVTVTQTVTVEPVQARRDLLAGEADWGWSELRDYVVAQIIERFGPFPRNSKKEYGIFNRFLNEHGERGILAARLAFEVYDGWWRNAPIAIERFAKGSDPYFVEPILQRYDDAHSS